MWHAQDKTTLAEGAGCSELEEVMLLCRNLGGSGGGSFLSNAETKVDKNCSSKWKHKRQAAYERKR